MAGDWFPLRTWLTKVREVVCIAEKTGRSRQEIVGYLSDLWSWATEEGVENTCPEKKGTMSQKCPVFFGTQISVSGITPEILISILKGDDLLWKAVEEVGWLKFTKGNLIIPNADRWIGVTAKTRLKETLRKRKYRQKR